MPALQRAIDDAGLGDAVEVLATTCRNRCDDGPSLNVYPGPVFYNRLDADAVQDIVREHLAGDSIARRWLYSPRIESGKRRPAADEEVAGRRA